jgi:chromosome partitioning protein
MTNPTDLTALIQAQSRQLSTQLATLRERNFPPSSAKTFRRIAPAEAARLLSVSESRVRQTASDHGLGEAQNARRTYSVEDVAALRRRLAAGARSAERYLPARRAGEHLQVVTVMNFKGGSAKTTTSAHLAQYLALRGYRVLAVDLDPQASLTALFGIHSVADLTGGDTVYGAIRYDEERRPLESVVRATYVPGLSLVPGGLELMEFEHETPRALSRQSDGGVALFARLSDAIRSIEDRFDIVIVDCPPQLGYLGLSALVAATSVLVTVHPGMLDVMSMSQFLAMTGDLLAVIADALPDVARPTYDWQRYLLTRFEPNDGPQQQVAAFLRTLFGDHVLKNPTLKSTAISDAGLTNQTIYEVDRTQFTRATYDRAVESVDAVNQEIEELVLKAWRRG